jgi:hypothetical protein
MSIMVCFYWILKLQAQFMAGGYAEALVSADKAKALLWASAVQIQLLDYFYYAGLTAAASYADASADEQQAWRELLRAHREHPASASIECTRKFCTCRRNLLDRTHRRDSPFGGYASAITIWAVSQT